MKHFSLLSSRIATIARAALFVLAICIGVQARAQITVTATAGLTGPTVYATLNAAISAVNAGTHQGSILFTVTANTTETLLSTLVQTGSGAANYSSLTIKPDVATNPVITGNIATGILFILGSNVTIDGSNTTGGSTQDLTIRNTSTAANSYVVRIGSPSTTLGAVNNQITNSFIQSSNPLNGGACILVGSGAGTFANAEAPNDKTVILNNTIVGAQYAIFYTGCVSNPDFEVGITGNTISATVSGIWFTFCKSSNINANVISGVPVNAGFAIDGILVNGTMVNVNVYNNKISSLRNTSVSAASAAYGLYLSAFNGPINVYNNFVFDIVSNGSATATANGEGIYFEQGSGYSVYHNTVNMTNPQAVAAGAPSAVMVGAGVTAPGAINLQNNIFANNQASGATQRYSIYSAAPATVFASIDYNDYYTTGPNLGFLGGNRATLAAVQTAFGSNTHSLNVLPPFTATTDPHISVIGCAGTPLESGGASVGIATDIDGQVRPGPVSSLCGGGTAPDIGADEFDAGVNDLTPPAITYTALPNICTPADVTLAGVNITDATGVPTTGILMPRIYFSKNAGPWFSAAGTLTAGTTISGTWSFTIPMATMGGLAVTDVVSYYVIAQDNFGNIIANPATGLVATDVNTVTTPPTTPNTYTIGVAMSGVYNVGVAGAYTTLTAAVNAYNTACLLGPVTFLLTDATYPSETFPITVRYNSYASAVNTLTIKPGGTTTISGAMPASGLFYLYGARYVTIDGSNSGTASRDLTWSNTAAAANSYVIRYGSPSPSVGARNNTVKNCIVTNGSATASTYGITSGSGTTIGAVAECPIVNNTIQNNNISGSIYAVFINGFSSTADSGWSVNNNTLSAGARAIGLFYMASSNVNNNIISTSSSAFTQEVGIIVNGAHYGLNIYNNKISGITNTGAFGAYGIWLVANSSSSNINVFNNFISNVSTGGSATIASNGHGIYASFGVGYNVVENSVNMNTNQTSGVSSAMCINGVTLPGALNIIDNIFANNQTAGAPVGTRYSIYSANPNTVFGTINYNDYYTTGTNLGFLTVARTTLANIQAGFGGNLNSINLSPTFVAPTDLHLQVVLANAGLNAGTPITGLVTDIDGDARVSPTIGADELILCPLPITGTPTVCVTTTTALTDATTGGVWSSVPGTGSALVSGTGVVTGVSAGTATISYTLGGCGVAMVVTINPSPVPGLITGSLTVCPTLTTALSNATGDPGGVWSSTTGNASVGPTGIVTGITAGTSTISYTVTNSCGSFAATVVVTVNPLPNAGAITGTFTVCPTAATILSDATGDPGGVWSSVSPGNATVGATGTVTGVAAGTSTISYTVTNSCGTAAATAVVTVNPLPNAGAITGGLVVCPTATIALADATGDPGGVWSSVTPGIATISASGVVTGVATGTTTISYTVTNVCGVAAATAVVTVSATPNAGIISGGLVVCPTTTTTLTDGAGGGVWSSVSPGIATVSVSGVVTGVAAGTSTISYTVTNSCGTAAATVVVTVNPAPAAGTITGGLVVCPSTTTNLTDAATGGVWSSVSPGIATVSGTGVVTGVAAGTSIISYAVTNSCGTAAATVVVTVNPLPNAGSITGSLLVCPASTSALTDLTGSAGGVWSSVTPGVATVSATGVVTGVANGTSTISYTVTNSCGTAAATAVVTVNPSPNPGTITGTLVVCPLATTQLSDAVGGGVWSSVSPGNATISATGLVSGVAAGTTIISYTVTNSCGTAAATVTVNVNPLPNAGTISGGLVVCPTTTTTLTDAVIGGIWSSVSPGVATISGGGIVTGVTGGTSTISYTVVNSCGTAAATVVVTVDPSPNAGSITGTLMVCPTATTALTNAAGGGVWSAVTPAVATVGATGIVTGVAPGTTTISYTVTNSCGTAAATAVVTVNIPPNAGSITGTLGICPSGTTSLTDAAAGGVWSSVSPGVATVGTSGVVTGVTAGTSTISYTVTNGCGTVAASVVVTVNGLPTAGTIAGTFTVCPTTSTTLINGTPGGVWTSSSPWIATVDVVGNVVGVAAGTTTISYAVTNLCGAAYATAVVTVNPAPFAGVITGAMIVCAGDSTLLSDAVPGGMWSSLSPAVASISATGMVTGNTLGTATIVYAVTNMCGTASATRTISVNAAPSAGTILGARVVCPATSITLSDPSSGGGGTWTSGSPTIATVGSTTGVVTGVITGTALITYSVTNSCATARTSIVVTVHPFPTAIMGLGSVCQENNIILSDSVTDGAWSSSNTGVATIAPAVGPFPQGIVSGLTVGTTEISYTVAPGCFVTKTITVNPIGAITLPSALCVGGAVTAVDLPGGGTWSSSTPSVITIGSSSGVAMPISSGAAIITYVLAPGCFVSKSVTVNILPPNYYMTGGGSYCFGMPGVPIGLGGSDTGVTYTLYLGSTPNATLAGTGAALDFGTYSVTGVYSVIATSTLTGCFRVMSGGATVTVTTPATPTVGIAADPGTLVCVGTMTNFTAIPTSGGTSPIYYWYVNGVSVGTGSTYGYIPSNGDVVSVKLMSNAGCISPDSAMNSLTMTTTFGLMPSVSLMASPGDSVCPGTIVTITPLPVNSGSSPIFTWVKNGVYDATGPNYMFAPVAGDNILCWMHSSLSCAISDSVHSDNNIVMNVPPIHVPVVNIVAYPGNRVEYGQTVTLVAGVTFAGNSLSYQWSINGAPVPGAVSDTFISNTFGNLDSVTCRVTGYSTCGSAEREDYIIIIDTVSVGVHNVGVRTADIRLIPNPNKGTFTLKGTMGAAGDDLAVIVTDMLGQVIYSKTINVRNGNLDEEIQLSNTLANGMYLLNAKSDTESKVFHFVIEK